MKTLAQKRGEKTTTKIQETVTKRGKGTSTVLQKVPSHREDASVRIFCRMNSSTTQGKFVTTNRETTVRERFVAFRVDLTKIQVLSFGPTQLDISLTWQKCEKGIFVQYDLIFISIGIVMQRTLSRNIELFAFTSNGHSIGKCQLPRIKKVEKKKNVFFQEIWRKCLYS